MRQPVKSDYAVLSALRNDPVIQRQLMIEAQDYSPAQVRAWIRRRNGDPHGAFWVIDADGPYWFVQLSRIDGKAGSADLGICVARFVRGKGVAGAAMRLLEKEAKRRGLRKLTLRVLRINHRAIGLYRKLKYATAETRRRHHFDGAHWRDVVFMEKALR